MIKNKKGLEESDKNKITQDQDNCQASQCDHEVQDPCAQCGFAIDVIDQGNAETDKGYTAKIDKVLTHRIWGFPIFLFIMWVVFQTTFSVGAYPAEWIQAGVDWLAGFVDNTMNAGALKDLIINGVIQGVGGIIVFLPNILLLFLFISIMEMTGYLTRTALIMDRLMSKIGLQGRSFVPLLIGFGCNVPAIVAARDLSNKKDRLLTMLIIPFMSCSARLPVYVLLISAFFPNYQGLILVSIYIIGMVIGAISAAIINKVLFRNIKRNAEIVLPRYNMPSVWKIVKQMLIKGREYIKMVGTVIVVASVIIWCLSYYPRNTGDMTKSEHLRESYIGHIGRAIEPVIRPLGFDWQIGVGLATGVVAKEMVVSTMAVLSGADETSANLSENLHEQTYTSGKKVGQHVFNPLVAYTLMLFILLYFPCMAVVSTLRREIGMRWAIFSVIYSTATAWVVSFIVYQVGSLFLN